MRSFDDIHSRILDVINKSQVMNNRTENKYKDTLVDQFISEIAFLKDEIVYLREDGKQNSNQISSLVNLLSQNVFIKENQNIQQSLSHSNAINDELNKFHFRHSALS